MRQQEILHCNTYSGRIPMSEINWFMRQIYRLILKEGWKVGCLEYVGDDQYFIRLVDPSGRYSDWYTTLYPKGGLDKYSDVQGD